MGARTKGAMPSALLSSLNLAGPNRVQVVDVQIMVPAKSERTPEQEIYEHVIRDVASDALRDAVDNLRDSGISEEELGALMGSVRLSLLMRLLEEDLEEVVLRYVESGGATQPLREVIASIMMPELGLAL